MYVVYIDVLFLINFVMDLIIFWIVGMLCNRSIKKRRLVIGSILASLLYCMLILFPLLQDVPYSLTALIIPVMPILYVYRPSHFKEFGKYYITSLLVAALLGGCTFSLWYSLGGYHYSISSMSIFYLFGIGLGLGCTMYSIFYYIRRRLILPTFEYEVTMIQEGRSIVINALLDTGNCLYTPISHRAVIVVEYDAIKALLKPEERICCESFSGDLETLIDREEYLPKFLIPFNSTGCEEGVLIGIEIDELIIEKSIHHKQFNKCIVGIVKSPLFHDHDYRALLHPDYILGEVVG